MIYRKFYKSVIFRLLISLALVVFLCIIPCSCANNKFAKDVTQLMGKEIRFSTDWDVVWKRKDTILADFMDVPVKMVVWIDSIVCSSCQIGKMYEWAEHTKYADSLAQWFHIVFLFSPKKEEQQRVNIALKANRINYPVFIDKHATFVNLNREIPKNRRLHIFLVDKNNNVVLVGNPLYNPTLWELYKRTIKRLIDNDGELSDSTSKHHNAGV